MSKVYKKIFIRSPNWIGDILLATPAIRFVRALYPTAHISVLIKEELAPALQGNPDINELITFAPSKLSIWQRICFYKKLKEKRFDLAVLFTNSFESAFAAWLGGCGEVVGYKRDLRGFFLTKAIKTPSRIPPRMHQADYYINLVSQISSGAPFNLERRVIFHIPEKDVENAERIWRENKLNESKFVVGFGAGAAFGTAKRWQVERFSQLGSRIVKELGGRVIIFGSGADKEVADQIVSGMNGGGLSLAGKTSIKTLGAMMKKCNLYITNDSGPMHIAAAVNTPILAIFGSTDPSETSPLSESYKIIRKSVECSPCWKRNCPTDHKCMEEITVEEVMSEIRNFVLNKKENLIVV